MTTSTSYEIQTGPMEGLELSVDVEEFSYTPPEQAGFWSPGYDEEFEFYPDGTNVYLFLEDRNGMVTRFKPHTFNGGKNFSTVIDGCYDDLQEQLHQDKQDEADSYYAAKADYIRDMRREKAMGL